MSQFNPNVPPPPGAFAPPVQQPRGANVWAIVSLITGILGCLIITPFVAIITGIVGLAKAKRQGGLAMAIIGIILGLIWIVGALGLGGLTIFGAKFAIEQTRHHMVDTANALIDGDVVKARAISALPQDEAEALSAQMKTFGKCTNVSFDGLPSKNSPGEQAIHVKGVASFDQAGNKHFDAALGQGSDGTLKLIDLKVD